MFPIKPYYLYQEWDKEFELTKYYPEYINEIIRGKTADEVVAMILDDGNKRRKDRGIEPIKLPRGFQFFQCDTSPFVDAYSIGTKHNKRRVKLLMGEKSFKQHDGTPLNVREAKRRNIRIHKTLQKEFNAMVKKEVESGFVIHPPLVSPPGEVHGWVIC